MIKMALLRTGVSVPEAALLVTILTLEDLWNSDPVAFYELVQLCRDQNHELFGLSRNRLQQRGIIDELGQPHDAIRDIVLASVDGDDLGIQLVSPMAR